MALSQEQHLFDLRKRAGTIYETAGLDPVEIHPAGNCMPDTILSIPWHLMHAGILNTVHECCYFLSEQIIDFDRHFARHRQLVFNCRRRVERIRIVLI